MVLSAKHMIMLMLLAFGLMVFAVSAVSGEEDVDINAITFPQGKWGPSLLQAIDAGPKILRKGDKDDFVVAPPPANDSEITKAELAQLHEFAKNERTEDAIARIIYENDGGKAHDFFMKEGLLDPANYKTTELLTMIDVDHTYFILERKMHFKRPRPSQLDPTLELVIDNPQHAAYPSGHASQTYMVALVLSEFDPENADKYKQFAIDIAHRREIAGLHYPSDSEAGRKFAVDVLKRLREEPVFEKKYQDAKASFTKPNLNENNGSN